MLGALSLLLGARADISAITDGESKCVIEGEFDISDYCLQDFFEESGLDYSDSCILRRELMSSGKSRSFVNDSPVGLSVLRVLSSRLIDIHSQHANLMAGDELFALNLLDTVAGNEVLLREYEDCYTQWKEAFSALQGMKRDAVEAQKNADFVRFQYEQLHSANLREGELETLLEEQQRLANAEDISASLQAAAVFLTDEERGACLSAKEARNAIRRIADYLPKSSDLEQRLDSVFIELQDIADVIGHEQRGTESNPAMLEQVEERIRSIETLLRKFGKETVEELIAEREHYRSMLERQDSFDFDIKVQEQVVAECRKSLAAQARQLHNSREKVIPLIEKTLRERLTRLGVRHALIQIQLLPMDDFAERGNDAATMLFAANLNQVLRPLSEVASGGELSRVMLALKTIIAEQHDLPTLIFDEVDSGVSGEVASEMADMMREIGENRQVIAITHLPQIAAKGKVHYKVYKKDSELRTETHIELLEPADRIREIAALMSGTEITNEALENAKKLMYP